ncbi:MAG: hypothetical protein JJU28_20935 [Cyclobacteriaceae bacterium]|nr:hypothetical protein [Cyclobacteriaceae bacterium]
MSKDIIFTCLPHKRHASKNNTLLLSVAVEIHLKPSSPTTLGSFPDVLNFAEKIKNASYSFRLSNGQPVQGKLIEQNIEPALWTSLMHAGIKVRAFENPDMAEYRIHSYPASHISRFIHQQYQRFAISHPDKHIEPEQITASDGLGRISRYKPVEDKDLAPRRDTGTTRRMDTPELDERDYLRKDDSFDQRVKKMIEANKFYPHSQESEPEFDFARFRDFFQYDRKGREAGLPRLPKPDFEFHDILSIISSYPQIQRKLGLVLDFEIQTPGSNSGNIHIVVQDISWDSPTRVSCPKTAFEVTQKGFYAASGQNSNIDKGFLRVNTSEFSAIQIDTEGAAMKIQNTVEDQAIRQTKIKVLSFNVNASRLLQLQGLPPETQEPEALPANRSAGIAIVQNGLAADVHQKFKVANILKGKLLDSSAMIPAFQAIVSDEILRADELVQGYRMDIAYAEDPEKWFSLHFKKDEYTWFDAQGNPNKIEGIEADEGYLQFQLAGDPEQEDDVYLPESIARWEGWSLSVNRPGYAINEAETEDGRDYVHTNRNLEEQKYRLDSSLDFRLEARPSIVPGTLPRLRFGRKYLVRIRTVDLAGNSVDVGHQPENASACVMPAIRYLRYEPVASPVVLPGTEFRQGESLERMVIRSNFNISSSVYEDGLPAVHRRSPESIRHLLAPKQGQIIAEKHGKFDLAMGAKPQIAAEMYQLITSRDGLFEAGPDGNQKVYVQNHVEIVYLPDPMAAGVSFFLAPFAEDSHSQQFQPQMFSFFSNQQFNENNSDVDIPENEWYKPKSMRIRLQEGSLNSIWDAANRMLTIALPKGERMKLRYSCWWRKKDLEEFSAMWDVLDRSGSSNLSALKRLAQGGRHWMISPFREIELVHALQQPLRLPVIKAMEADRNYGDTTAQISFRCEVHAPSTQQLDLTCIWKEPEDLIYKANPEEIEKTGSLHDIAVAYRENEVGRGTLSDAMQQGSGDVRLKLRQRALIQDFGDTKFRKVQYNAIAISRYQEHFDDLVRQQNLAVSRKGQGFDYIIIPSSSRPHKPEIEYLIPTFEWQKSESSTRMQHRRMGGGVRVYLKRPWYSSGEGEKLAVVLPRGGAAMGQLHMAVSAQNIQPFNPNLTYWAIDPIKPSVPANTYFPRSADFRYNPHTEQGLTLPGTDPNAKVDVVAYPVEFDAERKLWYADMALNTREMYFPFVKFALARYQQYSVRKNNADVCLSDLVQADFIQLAPERICTVEFRRDDQNRRFTITIEGEMSRIEGRRGAPVNYFDITFLKPGFGQPVQMIIDDGSTERNLSGENVRIVISASDVQGSRFKINRSFSLPRRYRNENFLIVVQEFELGDTRQPGNEIGKSSTSSDENQPRLVFADRFDVDAV